MPAPAGRSVEGAPGRALLRQRFVETERHGVRAL